MLSLKSGTHHYCRYEEEDGHRQHITAGGGGAFLHPTHHLPDRLDLPAEGGQASYRRVATYPSAASSRRLRKRVWLLPFFNLPLAAFLGVLQVLLAFMLELHLRDSHTSLGLVDLRRALWQSPTAFLLILLMLVMLLAMVRFAHDASGLVRLLFGLVHSMLQLAALVGVMIAASALSSASGLTGAASLIAFLVLGALMGGVGGTLGMSAYLWATNCLGFHGNEAYAPLHVMDFKHFLRLHIDADGALTVYPVGVDRVCRRWRICPDAPAHAPWLVPDGAEADAHLIERPVTIDR